MKNHHLFPFLCAVLVLSASGLKSAPAEAPLPDNLKAGLVLFYNFNAEPATGTIPDASGSGNNGSATGVQWVANGRNGGGSARFALTGSYITVPNKPSLNPPRFTLAAWIKTDYSDNIWRRIFDKGSAKAYALSICGDYPAGDSWRREQFSLELGVGGEAESGVRIADGQWHHIVTTFDGSEIRLYADGHPSGRGGRGGRKRTDPSFDLTIGANRSTPSGDEVDASFNGQMDDVMVYNRALSAAEVQKLFLAQGGVLASPSPLAGETPPPADLKYGLYIHYGMPTFAQTGGRGEIPASRFAPASVSVKAWAQAAKSAGMTFAVLTVKHESGFCLWDSAGYDYDVGSSPFKGDIIGDFIAACNAEGILPGAHYSIPDAHNEGAARANGPVPELYFSLIKKQITELHTKYPGLRVQIFDGTQRFSPGQWDELCGIIRKLNPQCVILDERHAGVPLYSASPVLRGRWFLQPNLPPVQPIPAQEQLQRYRQAQDGGRAFVLDVGPGPQGDMPENQTAALTELKQLIAQGPAAAKAPAANPPAKPDAAERLKQVKSLYDQGLINKDDYDKKVKEIMDSL